MRFSTLFACIDTLRHLVTHVATLGLPRPRTIVLSLVSLWTTTSRASRYAQRKRKSHILNQRVNPKLRTIHLCLVSVGNLLFIDDFRPSRNIYSMFRFSSKMDMRNPPPPEELNQGADKIVCTCVARSTKLLGTFSCFTSAQGGRSAGFRLGHRMSSQFTRMSYLETLDA